MDKKISNILLETGTNEAEILELFIDENEYRGFYGINVAKVIEIIPMPSKIIRPPDMIKNIVCGLFHHRDKVVVLIDLARWLNRTRIEKGNPNVIITEFNNTITAFLVSGVTRIHRVTWENIKPLDGYMENMSDAVTGVVELDKKMVFLLDLEKAIAELNPDLAIKASLDERDINLSFEFSEPIRVLHADDSNVIRHNVRLRLEEKKHFTVHSVINGDEAWKYLVDVKERARKQGCGVSNFIDVLLTDIEMPGMDGYHLCKRVKEDQELRSIPVILFSSLITEKLIHKGEAVGADGQFAKPDLNLILYMKQLVEKQRKAA